MNLRYEEGHLYRESDNKQLGSVGGWGYLSFSHQRKSKMVHRVIWELLKGEIPAGWQVDHIDHNKLNNRIENLRLVTKVDNCRNRSLSSNNKSGYHGIKWEKARNKWRVQIEVLGKRTHLGMFSELEKAIVVRKKAEEDYGYHKNHGMKT